MEDDKGPIPMSSSPQDIKIENKQFIVVIEVDMIAYKKTPNIPEWLNEEATGKGINLSQILQEALIGNFQQIKRR